MLSSNLIKKERDKYVNKRIKIIVPCPLFFFLIIFFTCISTLCYFQPTVIPRTQVKQMAKAPTQAHETMSVRKR